MKSKKQFTNFYDAWWWLNTSIAFYSPEIFNIFDTENKDLNEELFIEMGNQFERSLCIDAQKVDPKTRRIEKDEVRNTHVEVWLECGEYFYCKDLHQWLSYHNYKYD